MAGKEPQIPLGYDLYLDAFFRLQSERHFSDGVLGQIPTMKIIEYATWLDIDNVNQFIEVITRMDVVYINSISDQNKRKMATASKGK
jgi:hypothetical protein